MRVLVVSPQPVFQPRGTPLSVYYRTLITAELGHEVDLLTYGEGQDIDIPGVRLIRIPRFGLLGNVKVGPSILKLFLDCWLLMKTASLLVVNRYDLVHAHEEAVFFCILLKPLFRFRYLYDMHSSLPQQLTSFEFTRSRLLISLFERLERRALRSADAVITISRDLYEYAESIVAGRCPHEMIENTLLEPVSILPPPEDKGVSHLLEGLGGERLIVYAGTLEPYQGIGLLLEAFARVAEVQHDVTLLIAGGLASQVNQYRNDAHDLGIDDRCRFLGPVPRDSAMALNRRAAVLVSPRLSGGNTPLKIYEQLAAGIPLVATNIHSHTQVLNRDVAFLAEPNPDSFARELERALSDKEEAGNRARNAVALYSEKYSRAIYVQKMTRILNPF